MRLVRNLSIVVLFFSFVTFGCLEEDSPSGSENTPPEIPQLIIFEGPDSDNAPNQLQTSIEEFNNHMATGFRYLSIATISSPEVSENQATWEVSIEEFTGTIVANKNEDGTVDWTVSINGSNGDVTYNNWVAMEGTSSMDGSSGTWHIFEENSTVEVGVFEWSVDENNVKTGVFTTSNTDPIVVMEIVNNSDGSGSFNIEENSVKIFEAIWDDTGAGSWTSWDSEGTQTGSGDWT